MLSQLLFPENADLALENVLIEVERITVTARSGGRDSHICPDCGTNSQRVHSRYRRAIADLANNGKQVVHSIEVRRFFCDNAACQRSTFVEKLDNFAPPYARRSARLASQQQSIGLMVGGAVGARLSTMLAMPVSGDTILRLVRDVVISDVPTPRVVGIDDWAWRKGSHYGTIVVDLEAHRPIELLPDRSAKTLAAWLIAHPEIEIISRDRAQGYIEGIGLGAPKAIQVADRWHLLRNLGDVLKRLLDRHRECLYAAAQSPKNKPAFAVKLKVKRPLQSQETEEPASPPSSKSRQRRLARYRRVINLHKQGLSIREISRQIPLSRQTVRRYIKAGEFPEIAPSKRVSTALMPYTAYLQSQWQAGVRNAAQLFRDIQAQGYCGSYRLVRRWKTRMATEIYPSSPLPESKKQPKTQAWSANYAVYLLFKERNTLSAKQQGALERILDANLHIKQAYNFGQSFVRMVKYRLSKSLEPWLAAVIEYGDTELRNFAKSLARDKDAVLAALSLPWSNGQVEGQVNRLKLIKRQMYGRAKFDLLRLRVLAHP